MNFLSPVITGEASGLQVRIAMKSLGQLAVEFAVGFQVPARLAVCLVEAQFLGEAIQFQLIDGDG